MANSIPADFLSLGYKNGRIPDCALSSVNGAPNIKLHPQAAEQLGRLIEQAQREKISFSIGSAYRTFDSQVQVKYKQGRGAASPGKSNHGWGTTIDIAELYQLAVTTADSMNTTLPAGQKVDRFSPAVHEKIRQIPNGLYQWLSRNAPKYGWVNPEWAKDGVGSIDECWHWEYQVWPRRPDYVTVIPTIQPVTLRCGEDTPIRTRYARIPSGKTPPTSSITPNIGSLESFHPNIQYELTRRRIATNTAHTYMPFVKLTSLTRVLSSNLPTGTGAAWCPSLGPHGESNISFDEIYLPNDNRSIIGYAITDANNQSSYTSTQERVRVIVSQSIGDQSQIPMPGIVEVTAERGTAGPMGVRGGLLRTKLKIVAYSVNQINGLLRYFLRPATRVVLELGRRSSDNSEPFTPYNWEQTEKEIIEEFTSLILNPEAQTKFIEDYVYQNNGNYEIFIGYVVKFNLKYNKNNVYEIELDVHSVQQFEIPTIQTGVKSLCADAVDKCRAMDIREYFDEAYAWKPNSFKKLMSREEQLSSAPDGQKSSYEWADDFIAIRNPTTEDSGPGSGEAGLDENEYFVSWRFFVEKILNDPDNGILSVIPGNQRSTDTVTPTSLTTTELLRLGLLRPVKPLTDEELKQNNTSLVANEVGYHPDLRSTDPNVMIIYNKTAQLRRNEDDKRNYTNLINASITSQEEKTQFYDNSHIIQWIEGSGIGDFRGSTAQETNQAASGLLSNGVWLNTKAIKQAFMSTDTVTSAIDLLLSMMNAATQGYWNLQLYSNDRQHSGLFVIDMGLSKKLSNTTNTKDTNSSILTVDEKENILDSITGININRYRKSDDPIGKNKPKHIYMFNRGTKLLNDGELGSDLIDLNVDFNLPQVIAVQAIAGIGGPAQKGTLETIDIEELNSISLIKNLFATCKDSDICVEQTCDDDDLVSLENKWRQIEEEGTGPSRDVASQEIARQIIQRTYGNVMVIDTVRQLSDLGTALDYIEFNPARMIRKMNLDSRNAEATDAAGNPAPRIVPVAHAFNSSNLTKTTVSLTLPGIGGIELFQSFLVDRVPSILRSGFYLVTKVIHKFSTSNGWTTTLEGRFRYRPATENSSATKYSAECEPTTTVTSTTSATELRDRATRIAQRRTDYANRIANLSAGTLRQEFDLLENLVERPRFASIAQVEQWERRLNSGQVDIQREEFELVKAEIRKRNALGIQARQGIPEEFRSISDRRLTPKQWPAEGSGAGASF